MQPRRVIMLLLGLHALWTAPVAMAQVPPDLDHTAIQSTTAQIDPPAPAVGTNYQVRIWVISKEDGIVRAQITVPEGDKILDSSGDTAVLAGKSTLFAWTVYCGVPGGKVGASAALLRNAHQPVANTTWIGTEGQASHLTFMFNKNGAVTLLDATNTLKGTWSQNGANVTVRIEDRVYTGQVKGSVFQGSAQFTNGNPNTWSFRVEFTRIGLG